MYHYTARKHRLSRQKGVKLLQELSEGLGIQVGDANTQPGEATEENIQEAILRLLDAGMILNVQVKFCTGDLWNALSDRHGAKKEFVFSNFPEDRAKKIYKQLSQFGWVCSKWPPRERLKDLPWQFFVENLPNQQGNKQRKKEVWEEFLHPDQQICGLCGNSGYIDTRNRVRSPIGKDCGIKTYCICPNGRSIKKQMEGKVFIVGPSMEIEGMDDPQVSYHRYEEEVEV